MPTLGVLALALFAGCVEPSVVRVIDGRAVSGRFISASAYAYYARGADAEAQGDLPDALRAYESALDEDDSAEIWTRIGAVRCALLGRLGDGVSEAWRRAEALDPELEPLWRERARCDLAGSQLAEALASAERALAFDPDDPGATLALASALDRLGRGPEALRSLRSLALRGPIPAAAWRALHDLATRMGDVGAAEAAARHLGPKSGPPPAGACIDVPRNAADIDDALNRGEIARARHLALDAHLPLAELAVRAAALTHPTSARSLAELILAAEPRNGSARVALAAAADLSGDLDTLDRAIAAPLPADVSPPSPLARLVLAELLARRLGALSPAVDPATSALSACDRLYDELAGRLTARRDTGR